jgi:hypothetical protein
LNAEQLQQLQQMAVRSFAQPARHLRLYSDTPGVRPPRSLSLENILRLRRGVRTADARTDGRRRRHDGGRRR